MPQEKVNRTSKQFRSDSSDKKGFPKATVPSLPVLEKKVSLLGSSQIAVEDLNLDRESACTFTVRSKDSNKNIKSKNKSEMKDSSYVREIHQLKQIRSSKNSNNKALEIYNVDCKAKSTTVDINPIIQLKVRSIKEETFDIALFSKKKEAKSYDNSVVQWDKPKQKERELLKKAIEKRMNNILKDEKSLHTLCVRKIDKLKEVECTSFDKYRATNLMGIIFENNIAPSVQVLLGNKAFFCHLIVLQCFSDFFSKCGNISKVRLPLEYVTERGFRLFYAWCLSGKTQLRPKTVVQLLKVATFLRVRGLLEQCHDYIVRENILKEDIAFKVYLEARKFNMDFIAYVMLNRISKFFLTMVACSEFLYLTPSDINTILCSDKIGVNSEVEVLYSLARWLNFRWECRKKYCLSLVSNIRFALMPPWFLYALMRNTGSKEVDRIVSCPEVEVIIHNAMIYAMKRGEQNLSRDKILEPLKLLDSNEPKDRVWIYDPILKNEIDSSPNMSYECFFEYLRILRTKGVCYWKEIEKALKIQKKNQKKTKEKSLDEKIIEKVCTVGEPPKNEESTVIQLNPWKSKPKMVILSDESSEELNLDSDCMGTKQVQIKKGLTYLNKMKEK